MTYKVYGKYAHAYWIPLFPINKTYIVACNTCHETYDTAHFTKEITKKINAEVDMNPVRIPMWFYSGFLVLLAFVAFAISLIKNSREDTMTFYKKPKTGDIYEFMNKSGKYTTMKYIKESEGKDSVLFKLNKFGTNTAREVFKIQKDVNYKEDIIFSKKRLDTLVENKAIYNIKRK